MQAETVLSLRDIEFTYPELSAKSLNLKRFLLDGIFRTKSKSLPLELVNRRVLKSLSLEIQSTSRVALIGANGVGKTTLLRIAAGLLHPDSGSVTVQAKRLSLLSDRSTGLDQELTGSENCRLLLQSHGLRNSQLADAIVASLEISGLRERVHDLVREYSTGMQVRLRTSIMLLCPGSLLLCDEILGFADLEFRRRVEPLFKKKLLDADAIVFATHSPSLASQYCESAAWIHEGKVAEFGSVADVWRSYDNHSSNLR